MGHSDSSMARPPPDTQRQNSNSRQARSGVANAMNGADCSRSAGPRCVVTDPTMTGSRIPPHPVGCTPVPIKKVNRDVSLTYVYQIESMTTRQWYLSSQHQITMEDIGKENDKEEVEEEKGNTAAAADDDDDDDDDDVSSEAALQKLCRTPFPKGRSTGITYGTVTVAESARKGGANSGGGGPAAAAATSAPPPAQQQQQQQGETQQMHEMLVGHEYYRVLQTAWRQPASQTIRAKIPPPTDEEDLDDSFILDAIDGMEGYPLDPPVPLDYMIDLLTPQWEEEGLYEVVRRQEQQAASKGR